MRNRVKVSTAQASVFERHQYYQSVINRYQKVLYLCVGSVYTGNFRVAMDWKRENDPENRFMVIDTGAASGRLGLIAIATSRYSAGAAEPDFVMKFAEKAINSCEEYIFLDKLKYLAAGGRLSKTSAFFGDMINMKPVVSPLAEGAVRVGAVRNREAQLEFAIERLKKSIKPGAAPLIMLEYSDNSPWVGNVAQREIENLFPSAEIILQPISLTSGVHMGPGTWAIAFLPEFSKELHQISPED